MRPSRHPGEPNETRPSAPADANSPYPPDDWRDTDNAFPPLEPDDWSDPDLRYDVDFEDRDTEAFGADDDPYRDDGPVPAPARTPVPMPGSIHLPAWHLAGYGWRYSRSLTVPRVNRLLRLGAHRLMPTSTRHRFRLMGLPTDLVRDTLAQVRAVDDWAEAWTGAAQRFMGEVRRGQVITPAEAALARQRAALCYHVTPFLAMGDQRLLRAARGSATTLFAQSAGQLLPDTRRVSVRWRAKTLPSYLSVPSEWPGERPVVVLLNGITTAKEELILWREPFLERGIAVLALDWPGTGEATPLGPISAEYDDLADGLVELANQDPGLDPTQIALVGVGLGGSLAIRAAARDRRVAAAVAITPPFEPWRWLGASNAIILSQLATMTGSYDAVTRLASTLDLPNTLKRLRCPLLVLGAGRDLVVPPQEAQRLAALAGDIATLIWYPDSGHVLYDAFPTWAEDVADWLAVVLDIADVPAVVEHYQDPDRTQTMRTEPRAESDPATAASPGRFGVQPTQAPTPESPTPVGWSTLDTPPEDRIFTERDAIGHVLGAEADRTEHVADERLLADDPAAQPRRFGTPRTSEREEARLPRNPTEDEFRRWATAFLAGETNTAPMTQQWSEPIPVERPDAAATPPEPRDDDSPTAREQSNTDAPSASAATEPDESSASEAGADGDQESTQTPPSSDPYAPYRPARERSDER